MIATHMRDKPEASRHLSEASTSTCVDSLFSLSNYRLMFHSGEKTLVLTAYFSPTVTSSKSRWHIVTISTHDPDCGPSSG
jgi:hypothetical protein